MITATALRTATLVSHVTRHISAGFTGCVSAAWTFLGTSQLKNLLLIVVAICAIAVAQQTMVMERDLAHVSTAQQITGFAIMKQLQAMGITPDARAPTAHAKPAAPAYPPAAIAPEQLLGPPPPEPWSGSSPDGK